MMKDGISIELASGEERAWVDAPDLVPLLELITADITSKTYQYQIVAQAKFLMERIKNAKASMESLAEEMKQ